MGVYEKKQLNACECDVKKADDFSQFQKIIHLKKSGIVIYRYITGNERVNQRTAIWEADSKTAIFVLENTKNVEVTSAEYISELEKVRCLKCSKIREVVRRLLDKVSAIGKKKVTAICNYCENKANFHKPCDQCNEIATFFVKNRGVKIDDTRDRFEIWLSKFENFLKDIPLHNLKMEKNKRAYSDSHINKILREPKFSSDVAGPSIGKTVHVPFNYEKSVLLESRSENRFGYILSHSPFMHNIHKTSERDHLKSSKKTESVYLGNLSDFASTVGIDHHKTKHTERKSDIPEFEIIDLIPEIFNYIECSDTDIKQKYYDDKIVFDRSDSLKQRFKLKSDKKIKFSQEALENIIKTQLSSTTNVQYSPSISNLQSHKYGKFYTSPSDKKYGLNQNYQGVVKSAIKLIKAHSAENISSVKAVSSSDFLFSFPKIYHEKSTLNCNITSAELIKQTQEMFVMKNEDSKKKLLAVEQPNTVNVQNHKINIIEEDRKRLAKEKKAQTVAESQKLLKEERKSATRSNKASSKQLTVKTSEKHQQLKTKVGNIDSQKTKKTDQKQESIRKEKLVKESLKKEHDIHSRKDDTNKLKNKEIENSANIKEIAPNVLKETKTKNQNTNLKAKEEKQAGAKDTENQNILKEKLGKNQNTSSKVKEEKQSETKEDQSKAKSNKDKDKMKTGKNLNQANTVLTETNQKHDDEVNAKKQQEENEKKAREEAEKKATENEILAMKRNKQAQLDKKNELAKENPKDSIIGSKREPKELNMCDVKVLTSSEDLILRLVRIKQDPNKLKEKVEGLTKAAAIEILKKHMQHNNTISDTCLMCIHSDFELAIEEKCYHKAKVMEDIIIGEKISKYKPPYVSIKEDKTKTPMLFETFFNDDVLAEHTKAISAAAPLATSKPVNQKMSALGAKSTKSVEQEAGKGIIRYALSDRTFIDKGWTMLPTEKVVRKINVYRMRPAHPEFDWFEHNKNKEFMFYDTGEKLAEIEDSGRGRWYYRNGNLALDYYNAEEINAQQRFVIYSSSEPDARGRTHPLTVLATFDYLGNGVVFDHGGKIRLKYNQTEGVILDWEIGPVSHWKWHTLNDPPVLQQVMIDTQMSHKDPAIIKLGGFGDDRPRGDNEEMLAIEFDNFIKEKSKKFVAALVSQH